MGAKQSKRSVDISGKEAESAGEVAAAGAGGEGRVEAIADADALKPQLNGDAHIQPSQEISDKEKQLDSGTPENEKDATTEKEGKEQNDEKEATPVTNGDNEPKEENGDSAPTPEDGKKPKKEKVKKKWSLRSISFSRKDKPKQDKKPKEEEPKTNGEPEKVPEEAAEATNETIENKVAEVVKADAEVKEEQTPETPVTEPLTNGSSTPESPKVETLASDEAAPAPAAAPPQAAPAPAPSTTPDQLPVNGLSLDEPKKDAPAVTPVEESKPEESTPVAKEMVPVPEIPVKTEVCDAKMPLIEPTPPPLPANPPPSSVASFAATTMAPELIEASLANTTENAIFTPPAIPDTKAETPDEIEAELSKTNTDLAMSQLSPPLKETISEDKVALPESETETVNPVPEIPEVESMKMETTPNVEKIEHESVDDTSAKENITKTEVDILKEAEVDIAITEMMGEEKVLDTPNTADVSDAITEVIVGAVTSITNSGLPVESQNQVTDEVVIEKKEDSIDFSSEKTSETPEPASDPDTIDELPPPPPLEELDNVHREDKVIKYPSETIESTLNTNHNVASDTETNGIVDENEQNQIKNLKKDALGNLIDNVECNGNAVTEESAEELVNGAGAGSPEESPPPSLSEAPAPPSDASGELPPPPADLPDPDDDSLRLQDPLPITDKIADLIPEIPTVPELKTETETSSELAVAD